MGRDVLIIPRGDYQQFKESFETQLTNENPRGSDKSLDDFRCMHLNHPICFRGRNNYYIVK